MTTSPSQANATEILTHLTRGDDRAAERLLPLVYEELRGLAGKYVARHGNQGSIQPTMLVHEAYLRLVDPTAVSFNGQTHFKAVAARAMRFYLVDQIREHRAQKRGGNRARVAIDADLLQDRETIDVQGLADALEKLAELDERKAQVVEFRFFGGLSLAETASALGVARSTVTEDWRMARAWLACELDSGGNS